MDHVVHYDRPMLVRRLLDSNAPVVLIAGPSGIGKSDLLDTARHADTDSIASTPVTVRRSAGSLQRSLIRSLGGAASLIIERQSAGEQVGRHLSEAARRLADKGLRDLAKVIGKELLAVVRSRLGESIGDAFIDYLTELKGSYDERLEARLNAAADPDVVDIVVQFAEEVVVLANGAKVVLSLDNGESLDDQDLRLLADLVGTLPHGIFLRVAFATDRQRQAQLDELMASGARLVTVPPLTESEVAEWLVVSGVTAPSGRVHRLTNGYPLHLQDMIAHLRAGGMVDEVPLNEQLAVRTKATWHALDTRVAVAARQLAAFPEPLSPGHAARFLGLDAGAWAEIEDRLFRSGIFTGLDAGRRWFHEQRRRFVWDYIVTDEERPALAERAVEDLRQQISETGNAEFLPSLAWMVVYAHSLRERNAGLNHMLTLNRDELAVAAALLELAEQPPGSPAVLGDRLLSYAREAIPTGGDLLGALQSLENRGLVHVASNDRATAVVPVWGSALAVMVLSGRASADIGRLPIPGMASTLFQAELAPRIRSFTRAQYGIGRPGLAELSRQAVDLRRRGEDGTIRIVPAGPDLLVRGYYDDVPLYAAVTFNTTEQRDAAARALADLEETLTGASLRIETLMAHPYSAVPSLRFIAAAELLIGKSLLYGAPRLILANPPTPEEALRRRLAALHVIRDLSSVEERRAMEIEQDLGYLVEVSPATSTMLVAEVLGGRGGVELLRLPPTWSMQDHYARFTLARHAGLQPTERIGKISVRGGPPPDEDPAIGLMAELCSTASSYNKNAIPLAISLEEAALGSALQFALQRQYDDARALASAVQIGDTMLEVTPMMKSLILYPDSSPGWVPGYGIVFSHEEPSPSGRAEVRVRIEAPTAEPPSPEKVTADALAHLDVVLSSTHLSWARSPRSFARMLGYDPSNFRFET